MTRHWAKRHVHGTKAEVLAQLRELAEGWRHWGKDDRAAKAEDAIEAIEVHGSFAVKVGFTTYNVVEQRDIPVTEG